jgi:hypothetical protein
MSSDNVCEILQDDICEDYRKGHFEGERDRSQNGHVVCERITGAYGTGNRFNACYAGFQGNPSFNVYGHETSARISCPMTNQTNNQMNR